MPIKKPSSKSNIPIKDHSRYRETFVNLIIHNFNTLWETPHNVYIVGGNTDSSDSHTSLFCQKVFDIEFQSWNHVFTYLLQDDRWQNLIEIYDQTENLPTQPIELMKFMTDTHRLDPITFVRDDNSLLRWLVDVRDF